MHTHTHIRTLLLIRFRCSRRASNRMVLEQRTHTYTRPVGHLWPCSGDRAPNSTSYPRRYMGLRLCARLVHGYRTDSPRVSPRIAPQARNESDYTFRLHRQPPAERANSGQSVNRWWWWYQYRKAKVIMVFRPATHHRRLKCTFFNKTLKTSPNGSKRFRTTVSKRPFRKKTLK